MFSPTKVGCGIGLVIGTVLVVIVSWHESPQRITKRRIAAISCVSEWLQPTICSQLVFEAADLIKRETQKSQAQRDEESGLNWNISGYPALFGVQLAKNSGPIKHRASLVYMRESQGIRWTESCFPLGLSLGHRSSIIFVVNPTGDLPVCYHYVAAYTNALCGSVGFLVR